MSQSEHFLNGLITAAYGKRGRLLTANGTEHRFLLKGRKLKPVCGDRVDWSKATTGDTVILESLQQRRNILQRSGHKGTADVMAANLDVVLIVLAAQPKPDFFLTDRYIATAESMGCEAVIVRNKADLSGKLDQSTEAEMRNYAKLGYRTILSSAKDIIGMSDLSAALRSRTGILVGQSGVGKSSLINALIPTAAVAVAELSAGTQEGRHTTTASMMHSVAVGGGKNGWLIDSPGVRDFLPYFGDTRDIQAGFIEIHKAADECRFANCQHLREPGCAVKAGIETDTITQRRYDSYKRLYHMTAEARLTP